MRKIYLTNNPLQTKKLGEKLAKEILKARPGKEALILGLEGDLGGGKTTFLQGFAKGLGVKQKILSPTFIIMRKFKIGNHGPSTDGLGLGPALLQKGGAGGCKLKIENFFHIDCYRIKKPKELLDLGFKEIISSPKNIVAIEWAEKIKKLLPQNTLWIKFEFINEQTRKIAIKNFRGRVSRLFIFMLK